MARKNLLDQGRPGAGHSDNEYRVRRAIPCPFPRREKFGSDRPDHMIHLRLHIVRIMLQFRTAQRVTCGIMRERILMERPVFGCFPQGKVQMEFVFIR